MLLMLPHQGVVCLESHLAVTMEAMCAASDVMVMPHACQTAVKHKCIGRNKSHFCWLPPNTGYMCASVKQIAQL
jgi:hypothetical protein